MAVLDVGGRPVDVGASYFTVRDPAFERVVEGWERLGLARAVDRHVPRRLPARRHRAHQRRTAAVGGARAGCARWSSRTPRGWASCRATTSRRSPPGRVVDGDPVDAVVLAMPDPQAADLLPDDAAGAAGARRDRVGAGAVAGRRLARALLARRGRRLRGAGRRSSTGSPTTAGGAATMRRCWWRTRPPGQAEAFLDDPAAAAPLARDRAARPCSASPSSRRGSR